MPAFFELEQKKLSKILPTYCKFLVLLAVKSWRRKANFPLARAENSVMAPLLVAAASLVSDSGTDGEGGLSVKRKALSMRMIWLKLGLKLGSSTQHDWTINARSGDISSGRPGLACYVIDNNEYQVWNILFSIFIVYKEQMLCRELWCIYWFLNLKSSSISSLQVRHAFEWQTVG